jgi:hypothetical protein
LIETTTSWENRFGRVRLGHQNSRNLIYKSIPPGSLHQKFLGSLEGRRIKEGISKTRNDQWRGYNLHNHGFPNIIEIVNEKLYEQSSNNFPPHNISIWDF